MSGETEYTAWVTVSPHPASCAMSIFVSTVTLLVLSYREHITSLYRAVLTMDIVKSPLHLSSSQSQNVELFCLTNIEYYGSPK